MAVQTGRQPGELLGASAMSTESAEVVIVGAGPSGLAAATELRRAGAGSVVVIDREHTAGGIPRHAQHAGFGLRDLHRPMSGPRYAARWTEIATAAGAELRLGTQATGWTPDGAPGADRGGWAERDSRRSGRAGDRLSGAATVGAAGRRARARRG